MTTRRGDGNGNRVERGGGDRGGGPGSTLYAVWTHDRTTLARDDVGSDWDRLRSASGRSVFMLKASWWLGL